MALTWITARGGGELRISAMMQHKKIGRDRHHHGRALRRRSMGQGGMTGCRDDSRRAKSFLMAQNFFHTVK
jgi:hypothetical protein